MSILFTDIDHNSSDTSLASSNKIEKRSDTNVDLTDSIRVVDPPQYRSKGPGGTDRNGFFFPELNLLGAGYAERPSWHPYHYNPDFNGESTAI